jgi:hypothetical protein
MMMDRVDAAVQNNIAWCGTVCDTHGIAQAAHSHVWGVLSKAPAFYPDIISSSRNATTADVQAFAGRRDILSIKDSYANLDLSPFGFDILFEAEWIYRDSISVSRPARASWRLIATEKDLMSWTHANGLQDVIKADLLKQTAVKLFMHEEKGEISGFIANLAAGVVGISNVFTTDHANEGLWLDIASIVSAEFPGVPMVGYERAGDLSAALLSGFTSIGSLRVWVKSS